nr:hypothetical protein [Tanacetum cinerariifolium]
GSVIGKSDVVVVPDFEDTLMLAEQSRSKMIEKQNDPQMIDKKVITKPIDYAILNKLSTDFNTRFVPQTESSAEQAFWSQYSVQTDEPNLSGTTIVEVLKELPKVSMTQMENVLQENDRLLTQALRVEIVNIVVHDNVKFDCLNVDACAHYRDTVSSSESAPTFAELFEINDLKAQASLQEKVLVIAALKEQLNKLKGKAVLTEAVSLNPIDPALLQVDVALLVPKLRKNRTAHYDYIRHTQEEAATLREIVERRTFTLVGNVCPLARIATATIVPPRDPIPIVKSTDKPVVTLASKTKFWLWHRRLSQLNFGAINHLARQGLVRGLSKLKFEKDHLCSACAMGKSTKKTHKPKSEDTNQEKLYLLHMDLCGPMRVESVNGKKYILIIVDDYSRFTWQNGIVERHNRTLIEAAHTMLIYAQAPLFLWAVAVATPDLSFFHVFGALWYPTNDIENIGKLQPKADIGIFIGYAPTKKAFRIYNRRTRRIVETIDVDFDELTAMASEQSSSGPALQDMIPGTINSGLMQKSSSSTSYVPPSRNDWDLLFQPLFDELLNPPPSVDNQAAKVIAPIAEIITQVDDDSTGSPSSTTVDQDAPSPSKSTILGYSTRC